MRKMKIIVQNNPKHGNPVELSARGIHQYAYTLAR
jgi:hypothetical protein